MIYHYQPKKILLHVLGVCKAIYLRMLTAIIVYGLFIGVNAYVI